MKTEIIAIYNQDSKRYHRFLIDGGQEEITGTIYIPKGKEVPEKIVVLLKTAGGKV
jgi:hypothetical protein